TTVDHAGHLIGSISAKLILERLSGRIEPVHHVVAPQLVIRKTTAAASGKRARRADAPTPSRSRPR
ncbi:MAG: hypothetical protein ABW156_02515, partial [Jiangellaceae bacterium]